MPRKKTKVNPKVKTTQKELIEATKKREETNQDKLGWLGEWIGQEHLNIELSYNPLEEHHPVRNNKFDSVKDGFDPSGRTVEVKTQNRHKRGYFTVDITTGNMHQVNKCVSVDRLIFIEYDFTNDIKIWECNNRDWKKIEVRYGVRAGWPIRDMTLLLTIGNEEMANQMRVLSQSVDFKEFN